LPVRSFGSDTEPDSQECLSHSASPPNVAKMHLPLAPDMLHFRNLGRIPEHFTAGIKFSLSEKD